MKRILLILVLLVVSRSAAEASEIFGRISTNPKALPSKQNNQPSPLPKPDNPLPENIIIKLSDKPTTTAEIKNPSGGSVIIPPQANKITGLSESGQPPVESAKILGVKYYSDDSLLRGPNKKIYLIKNQAKKHIANLKELNNYQGQIIIEVTDEELSFYQTRPYLAGELVRQLGEVKIYLITAGAKHHILNLAELKAHFFGREIFNVSREEIALY